MEDLNTLQLSSTSGKVDDIISASSSAAIHSNVGYGFEQDINNYSENNAALPLISSDTEINLDGALNEQNLIEEKEYSGGVASTITDSITTPEDGFETSKTHQFDGGNIEQSGNAQNQFNSSYGWIEEQGNASLYNYWDNYYVYDEDGYNFIDYTDSNGWSIIGAEKVNEVNQLAFGNSLYESFYRYNMDSNWDPVDGDWLTGESLYQAESDFGQDFNADGITGSPTIDLETVGSIHLVKDSSGNLFAKDSSSQSLSSITVNNNQITTDSWNDHSLAAAETINGINEVINQGQNGDLYRWQLNSNWNLTGDSFITYNSAEYHQAESDFGQDFNADGQIGITNKISGITNSSIINNINISLTDDLFTHQELKSLLVDVSSGGVTATELSDLQTIETNLSGYLSATDASYQSYIFDAVVNGNSANQWWTGGESSRISLGNLYEGSTEAHLNSLVDKWYGGLDRPTNFVQGDSAASASAMTFDYDEMVGDLFVDGVNFDDVRQGQAGTCYVLAAACSYADSDSSIITEMFKDNGDGTYGVRFYDNSLSEIWVTVDSYVPSTNGYSTALAGNASWGLTGEKWVALLEKGYAQANETGAFARGSNSSKNSYAAVEGGWMDALTHLSGNTTTTVSLNYTGTGGSGTGLNGWTNAWGSQTSWNAFETQAISAINGGKALWLGSFGNTWGSNGRRNFVAGHAFAITAYNASTGLFTIVNPWGSSSGSSNHTFTASWSELATYGLDPIVSWA
ncbi:C2 family cysteine protease [Synechococcus sp. UW179A]|uniref:C2 family cysteine protease n=1 Tax=Synechococcus sp. UW179A TaxID=2575510 RepID=UPI000E0FC538|nr:C2 family cysteine protease [Synechococcus sp. UW179A]